MPLLCRRSYLSVAAAAIYMASQASESKKSQKGDMWVWLIAGGGEMWVWLIAGGGVSLMGMVWYMHL